MTDHMIHNLNFDNEREIEEYCIFYGTGAAEGIPDPFCDCYMCNYARIHGGKNIRKRSSFRVGKDILIDIGPDIFTQSMLYGSLRDIENILITHTHDDHFNAEALQLITMATNRRHVPINIYFVGSAYRCVDAMENSRMILGGGLVEMESEELFRFHKLEFYKTYQIGEWNITPVCGNHGGNMQNEISANYLMENDRYRILYGLDTGYYQEQTINFLKDRKINLWISECTFGNLSPRQEWDQHLCIQTLFKLADALDQCGALEENCPIYVSHINHCHTAYHQKLQNILDEKGKKHHQYIVAYDGLKIRMNNSNSSGEEK